VDRSWSVFQYIERELERGGGKQKASEVERGKVSYQRYELLGEESQ